MKKLIAIILAVMTIAGCVSALAYETETANRPLKPFVVYTPEGTYIFYADIDPDHGPYPIPGAEFQYTEVEVIPSIPGFEG